MDNSAIAWFENFAKYIAIICNEDLAKANRVFSEKQEQKSSDATKGSVRSCRSARPC